MPQIINYSFKFGVYCLNAKEKILLRGNEVVPLTPKVFELLTFFVENQGRLIEKDEIMQKLWADSFVEESNLTFNIRQLRKILNDTAQNPTYIETVWGHGYRFISQVEKKSWDSLSFVLKEELNDESPNELPNNVFFSKRSSITVLAASFLILIITLLSAAFIYSKYKVAFGTNAPILKAEFNSEKLTNTGGVFHAVISPDGKRMAYTNKISNQSGVWIREIETGENIQIVPNSEDSYQGLKFSADGETVFFVRTKSNEAPMLYKTSIFGSVPKHIISGVNDLFSLSPDSKYIAFVRCAYQENDFCSLNIADIDGKNERTLLTRPRPIRIGDNQFSPDGKLIAVAVGQSRNSSQDFTLVELEIETGKEREITKQKFFDIKYLFWLPDQNGLIFTGWSQSNLPVHIYQVSNQTGEAKQLTKDSNNYSQLSFDTDFQKMIVTQATSDFQLWVGSIDNLNNPKAIGSAQGRAVFTPSGKIVYCSITDGTSNIWITNTDGTNQRQLTSNHGANLSPRVSPDERFIFFSSNRSGSKQIWRMNIDGSDQIQVSENEAATPIFVSADGNSVFYTTALTGQLGKITFNNDGSKVSTIVLKENMGFPEIDPTGKIVAYFSRTANFKAEIVLSSLEEKKKLKSFTLAEEKSTPLKIVWANDGKSLFYLTISNHQIIVWHLSLETGKTKKFADLGNEEVFDFSFSADGKTFTFTRGKWKQDAFLMKGLK